MSFTRRSRSFFFLGAPYSRGCSWSMPKINWIYFHEWTWISEQTSYVWLGMFKTYIGTFFVSLMLARSIPAVWWGQRSSAGWIFSSLETVETIAISCPWSSITQTLNARPLRCPLHMLKLHHGRVACVTPWREPIGRSTLGLTWLIMGSILRWRRSRWKKKHLLSLLCLDGFTHFCWWHPKFLWINNFAYCVLMTLFKIPNSESAQAATAYVRPFSKAKAKASFFVTWLN